MLGLSETELTLVERAKQPHFPANIIEHFNS